MNNDKIVRIGTVNINIHVRDNPVIECPICEIKLTREELISHLLVAHGKLYDDDPES